MTTADLPQDSMNRHPTRRKTRLSGAVLVGGWRWMIGLVLGAAPGAVCGAASDVVPVLRQHCVGCHGKDGKVKGELNLLEVIADNHFRAEPELLTKVIQMVRDREMPPEDEPALASDVHGKFLGDLQAALDAEIASGAGTPRTP